MQISKKECSFPISRLIEIQQSFFENVVAHLLLDLVHYDLALFDVYMYK